MKNHNRSASSATTAATGSAPISLPPTPPTRLLLTIEQAAHALSISRTQCYRLVNRKVLKSVLVGHLRRVTLAEIERYISELSEDDNGGGTAA
jgi:excisionase family DNA binding protein